MILSDMIISLKNCIPAKAWESKLIKEEGNLNSVIPVSMNARDSIFSNVLGSSIFFNLLAYAKAPKPIVFKGVF